MTTTDELLCRLKDEPLPVALHAIEPDVMDRVRHRVEARLAHRSLAMAGMVALAIGVGSSLLPQTSAEAAQPLLGVPTRAPSNLLSR